MTININIYSIVSLVSLCINLVIFFVVAERLKKEKDRKFSRYFYYLLLVLMVFFWQLIEGLDRFFDLGEYSLVASRFLYFFMVFIGLFFYLFVLSLLTKRINPLFLASFLIVGGAISMLAVFSNLIVYDVLERTAWGHVLELGSLSWLFFLYNQIFSFLAHFVLFLAARKEKKPRKRYALYAILVSHFIFFIYVVLSTILLRYYSFNIIPFASSLAVIPGIIGVLALEKINDPQQKKTSIGGGYKVNNFNNLNYFVGYFYHFFCLIPKESFGN